MESHFLDSMTCPICLELADNAVETSCCHQIYCEYCLSVVGRKPCPQCRQPFEMLISHIARRMIGSMPVQCPIKGCKMKVMRSELKDHELHCVHRLYKCPAPKCMYEGLHKDFAMHLAMQHEDNLLQHADDIFRPSSGPASISKYDDRIGTKRNERGAACRLGSTGKFYCGQGLDAVRCSCCDGHCGPTNGCNCSFCMKLDIRARKLQKGWYVNRDGFACRMSRETGHMYCGRLIMQKNSFCDGYCGPTNGPNCEPCRILQNQVTTRYLKVWED